MANSRGQHTLFLIILIFILSISLYTYSFGFSKIKKYKVINVYPHDSNAQTEGLIYHKGDLYEGTGPCLNGPSSLRKINIKTGDLLKYISLDPPIFGEGITIFGDRIIQLTYKLKTGYVYSLKDFRLLEKFHYSSEGWGLTHNGKYLIMSDGTPTLHFLDPVTFKEIKKVIVHRNRKKISKINELEFINGRIYANVFLTDLILVISPETGEVMESIGLKEVLGDYFNFDQGSPANGIAYDPENNDLLITGKYWPNLFRISLPEE
ncbi:glutaminyl-peptide cyclotransferase [Thermodesulfobacteriota bacterium]